MLGFIEIRHSQRQRTDCALPAVQRRRIPGMADSRWDTHRARIEEGKLPDSVRVSCQSNS